MWSVGYSSLGPRVEISGLLGVHKASRCFDAGFRGLGLGLRFESPCARAAGSEGCGTVTHSGTASK